ncbi:hypothetical protein BDZ45DRAFT_782437, partial [Acephala macrosclerotiorum]
MTSKSIRRAQRAYKANPTKANLDMILKSQEKLAAQHEVDRYFYQGLEEALKDEKKRRQRGKRLNLVGEEEGEAQLFSDDQVRKALEIRDAKEALEAAEKAEKAARKVQATEKRERKAQEAQDRALQRQVEREAR